MLSFFLDNCINFVYFQRSEHVVNEKNASYAAAKLELQRLVSDEQRHTQGYIVQCCVCLFLYQLKRNSFLASYATAKHALQRLVAADSHS